MLTRAEREKPVRTGRWMSLALLTFGMAVLPVARAQEDQPNPFVGKGPGLTIEKPTDPKAVKGTWTIAGAPQSITAGEFYALHVLMNGLEGTSQQGVTTDRVWEHILAAREADAMGIFVSDEEVDAVLQKDDADIYDGILKRWKQLNVAEADGRNYLRDEKKADKLRDMWLNNVRVSTKDAYDIWKQQHYRYKLDYVAVSAADFAADLAKDKIDDATLKTFWNDNQVVQAQFRTPNTVSAEFIYLDQANYDATQLPKDVATKEISREDALEYFTKNKDLLMSQVPADKQHLLLFTKDTPVEKVVSPFSVLEDTIKTSLRLREVINAARESAGVAGAKLEDVAKKFGLGFQKCENLERPAAMQQLNRFGFNIFNTLNGAKEGEISTVADERGVRYFYRLTKRQVTMLPEFAAVREKVLDKYIETQTNDKARAAAQAVVSYMNQKITSEIQPLQDRLLKEADAEAEKRIAEMGLAKEEDKVRERNRCRSTIRQKVEEEKKRLRPQYFDEYRKAHAELKMLSTDYFEFQPMRGDRQPISDPMEARMVFFRTNYFVQSLTIGDITPVILEDPQAKTFYVARLADKAEPDIAGMSATDLHQAEAQLKQMKEGEFLQRWRKPLLARRVSLNESGK